ncbi:hypothetical protein F5876DRAFT_64353 [Lentinula aff. lateritia]|uniref:Uncharacterized protein n=1 Tax=Lentinula aff. lateritia TaxID=2804960 RepID=A0ACC1U4L8_9AGAR|nr:hypothetical protein F5876DRAFT_64353 [Lentinula aff. lateritia]
MAAPSGITYKAKCSNREVLRERLENNSALREHFESSRDVHHYKKLTRPTMHNHETSGGITETLRHMFKKLLKKADLSTSDSSAFQGRDASAFIRLETLRGYMSTFLALWPRYANVHPTPEMRYQLHSYLLSEELRGSVKLSTKDRTLKHIEPQCLQIIMETLHSATNIFRSNRIRLQMAFLILFSAASAACPGSIVESACYRGSNKALTWGDVDFYLIPDDEDPAHPSLVVDIQLNLVKGYRDVDHRYQKLLFTLELHKEHRTTCIVLPLLGLAFHDSVFAHFHSIESLRCPEKPPYTRVKILLRNEVLTLPLLRKEEKGGGGKVSKTEAFPYDGLLHFLKSLSIAAGFLESITPYDFRASQGNKAGVDLGETARKTLMLHDPNSKVYFANADQKCQNKYKSKTMTADLSAVSNRRSQDENRITLFRTAVAASSGRDTNAPQHLSLAERAKLLNEPELVKLQNEKDEATNKIQQLLANEQSEEVEKQIIELRQIAAKASNGHRFLYLRESCLRIKQARQEFFDNAAVRQMLNPAEPVSRMSAGGSDDKKYRVESSFLSLVLIHDLLDDILGDRQVFNNHHLAHYEVLFDRFGLRPSEGASVSLLPIGIIETEKYIEYAPGSGFDGVLPEFHGHFSDGIALVPGFCPTCVFDEKLPMYMRMHQFSNVFRFMEHFNHIHRPHFSESENLCPVPSCGHNRFTKQELIVHLIKFHRIPLASTGKNYRVKRLLLPSPDMEAVKYKRRKKSEGFWCLGCSGEVNDINKHLQRPQNSEKARECARIGKYSVIANGEHGPVQLWTAPSSSESQS